MSNGQQDTQQQIISCGQILTTIFGSSIFFFFLSRLVNLFVNKSKLFDNSSKSLWRLKNTCVSWLHAIICSMLVINCIFKEPRLLEDMIKMRTIDAYITICVSLGYFIYDTYDIVIVNGKLNAHSYEVLLHHVIIVGVFWVPLYTSLFIGYTIAALLLEFNTVFLHFRYILVFNNVNKSVYYYKIVSYLNIITFLIFRILTLCWMTRWIVINRELIDVKWFTIGSVGLCLMLVINAFLLQRLIQADFSKNATTSNGGKLAATSGVNTLTNGHIMDDNFKYSDKNN